MYYRTYLSPLGEMVIEYDEKTLFGVYFIGQKHFPDITEVDLRKNVETDVVKAAVTWFDRYFCGKVPDPTELPLSPQGGEFRQTVWRLLTDIRYGETITYGELAKKVARKLGKERMSAQAVGGAVGHNPISIIVPCHRVIGTDDSLTGYDGGLDKKTWLLRHEGVIK